jgi:hypothetical protein
MDADIDYYELGQRIGEALSQGATFSPIEFGLNTKQCKKGIPCGGSCISSKKSCKGTLDSAASAMAGWIGKKVPKGQASSKNPKTPTAAKATDSTKSPAPNDLTPPAAAKTSKKKAATKTPEGALPETTALNSPVKVNKKELEKTRKALVDRYGEKLVKSAEENVDRIVKESDVHIRVGSSQTLDLILGGGFKTAHELGRTAHNIPRLKGDYLSARARVEAKSMGYDKSTEGGDRPIYGYLGSKNPKDHLPDVAAYGSITVKLKPEAKDRATITGSDSFKSGIASKATSDGDPPPPNAASLIPSTRHGYDIEKLPKHYPSNYRDSSRHGDALAEAAKAKTAEDLAKKMAPTGNAYVEMQVHGGVKPQDIGEIHFAPKSTDDRPNQSVVDWAQANGVKVFVNGKEIKDGVLPKKWQEKQAKVKAPATPTTTPVAQPTQSVNPDATKPADKKNTKTKAAEVNETELKLDTAYKSGKPPYFPPATKGRKATDLGKAMEKGDFESAINMAKDIERRAKDLDTTPANAHDKFMAIIANDTGAGGTPKIVEKGVIDEEWKKGGHLLVRGVPEAARMVDFAKGEYFVGNITMYGSGQYTAHAGRVSPGATEGTSYNPETAEKDAKKAWDVVVKRAYVSQEGTAMRMALPSNAKVPTQTQMSAEIKALDKKIDDWAEKRREEIRTQQKTPKLPESERIQRIKEEVLSSPFNPPITFSKVIDTVHKGYPPTIKGQKAMLVYAHDKNSNATLMKGVVVTKNEKTQEYTVHTVGGTVTGDLKSKNPLNGRKFSDLNALTSAVAEAHSVNAARDDKNAGNPKSSREETFNENILALKRVTFGDSSNGINYGDKPSGRYALLKGYDGVMLNDSYEGGEYFVLYNRSKAMLQDRPVDWKTAKTEGIN